MELDKYSELISFFYTILKKVSKDKFLLFKEFLKELNIDEKKVNKFKIKDKDFLNILTDIYYNKKIDKSLKERQPPKRIQRYIDEILSETKNKAQEFFALCKAKKGDFSIEEELKRLHISVKRKLFQHDKRILPDKDSFNFELYCFYQKQKKRLEITLSTRFHVKESEVTCISSTNLTIFDGFAQFLGFSDCDKNVQFEALFSEGKTFYDNTCELYWLKTISM